MNRIYKMDCLEGLKKVKSNSVRLIVADPPYFLGMTHNGQKGSFIDLAICKPFFTELFNEFKRVLTNDGSVFFFCDWRGYAFYYPIFDNVLGAKNLIVWDKISGAGNFYSYNHELAIFHTHSKFNTGGSAIWKEKSFSSGAKKTEGEKVHPTQKVMPIIERMILDTTNENDFVLDPFCGSGTTGFAAKKLNRNFIGFELNQEYFEVIKKRKETLQFIDL